MTRAYLAAFANFFLPGLGYIIAGGPRRNLALGFLPGVIGLTYVEFAIKNIDTGLYWGMFASVLAMNTAFAVDAYRTAADRIASGAARTA